MARNKTLDKRIESLEKERIISRYLAGETVSQIARSIKISTPVISQIIRDAGIRLYRGKTKDVDINLILELRSKGLSTAEIASELNIGISTINLKLNQANQKLTPLPFKEDRLNKNKDLITFLLKEGLTNKEIAKKLNTSVDIISRYVKNNLDPTDKRKAVINKSIKEIVNSILDGSSISKEATSIGVSPETLKRKLKDRGVEIDILQLRNRSCLLPGQEEREILYGEILGDAHISSNGSLCLCSVKASHIKMLKEKLAFLQGRDIKYQESQVFISRQGKECIRKPQYRITSLVHEYLKFLRSIWYKDNNKILPKNFDLSPTVIRHWYYGDGHISKKDWLIQLSTNALSKEDVELLVEKLRALGLTSTKTSKDKFTDSSGFTKESWSILISNRSNVIRFLQYIHPCTVEEMNYKHQMPEKFYLETRDASKVKDEELPLFD